MKQAKPIIHGRDHLPGGADPMVQAPLPGGTYTDKVMAEPSLWAFWPLDDTAGDFHEEVAGRDMSNLDSTGVPGEPDYTFTYGLPGPFTDAVTSTGFTGKDAAFGGGMLGTSAARSFTPIEISEWFSLNHPFTVELWAYPTTPTVPNASLDTDFYGYLAVLGGTSGLSWYLRLQQADTATVAFGRDPSVPDITADIAANEWCYLAVTFDGTTASLYVNGGLAGSDASTALVEELTFQIGRQTSGYAGGGLSYAGYFEGRMANVAIYTAALDPGVIADHAAGPTEGEGDDLVLGIDDSGNLGWVQPKVDVTVNGEPADTTPDPPRTDPVPPPDSGGPDGSNWIQDQPFTWGGPTFQVPPNKWTTIPFSSPLMERQSTPSGGSTTWYEIDWDDPDAAGWIDPATPRVITVPHDIPFDPGNTGFWLQICLKLEIPPVEDEISVEGSVHRGSHRGLRVFETTHQKSVLEAFDWRGACCNGHGAMDVFRDPTKHSGLLGDANMFASGDSGGAADLTHGNIMLVPNSDYGYYLPGLDWLPGHASGNPTLKEGMRLVPQVWHNASQTLTFDCTGVLPYRPHFVLKTPALRSWGPPWSTWPT